MNDDPARRTRPRPTPAPGLLLLAALALPACSSEPGPEGEVLRPVRTRVVRASSRERIRTLSGVSKAGAESRLSFKVAGTVRRLSVSLGETVEAGAVLAELDSDDHELQVQQAEAARAQARAQERNAQAAYERTRALYENENASRSDLDAARAGAESAAAAVRSADKQLQLAKLQLRYTTLRSVLPGSVSEVLVEENENVSPGQPVLRLSSGALPEVQVSVPEVLISGVEEGAGVAVRFDALPERTFAGVVAEVGAAATASGSTFPVNVRLQEENDRIRPGMAAEVRFSFPDEGGEEGSGSLIVVPPSAVGEDRDGRFVYVAEAHGDGTGEVRRRAVTVGALEADGMVILDGLGDGDRVVTAGVRRLRDGFRVKLDGPATGAPGS